MFMTLMAEPEGREGVGGGLQHNKENNKQVSKVIAKISEAETNVLIIRLAG